MKSYNKIVNFFYVANFKKANLFITNKSFTVSNNEANLIELKSNLNSKRSNNIVMKNVLYIENIFIKILSSIAEKILFFNQYLENKGLPIYLKYKIKNSNNLTKFVSKNIYLFFFFSIQNVINITRNKLKSLTYIYG
jgi:hypothetical protein